MSENLQKVKDYLDELELSISSEDEAEELVIIDDEDKASGLNPYKSKSKIISSLQLL